MKVPNKIKDAIKKTTYHSFLATKYNSIVREWLEKQNIVDSEFNPTCEKYSHIPDSFIDMCEIVYIKSNGEGFIQELEKLQ